MTILDPHAVGIVAIGDELLAGAHPDLDSPHLARRLGEFGRHVLRVVVVSDDEDQVADAVRDLASRAPLVFVSGGLGPTLDDVTRHGVARAAGVEVVHSDEAWTQITDWYAKAEREMPASNRRQALIPAGAAVLPNRCGTAPGFRCAVGEALVFALPGPPAELEDMVTREVAPWLAAHPVGDQVFATHAFHLSDLSESVFAERAGEWMARDANPRMGCTVKAGILSAKMVARGPNLEAAEQVLVSRRDQFRERFAQEVFSERTPDLALALGEVLLAKDLSVTLAESCTGGLIAGALTRAPGISAVLREAVVTYSDQAKVERLGVDPELIRSHGAVSAEVAAAMAAGAAARSGARLALSVTGVAGPGGGSPEKPVGLVWFGLAVDGRVETTSRRWPDVGRERIRAWAQAKGLGLLLGAARGA